MKENAKVAAIERILVNLYAASVCLSPLGPVVHYVLWAICLVLMTFSRIKYGVPFCLKNVDRTGKIVLACWGALSLWTIVAGLLTFHDLESYGSNASIFLEVTFGMYLAARFFACERNRQKLMRLFVWASLLILLGNWLRVMGVIGYFPNRSLQNGNALGLLGILLLPPLVCTAFWRVQNWLLRSIVIAVPCLVIFFSFSSGAWLAAVAGGLVLLCRLLKFKKLKISFVLGLLAGLLALGILVDERTGGKVMDRFMEEYCQVTAVKDLSSFTTCRDEIWRASLYMIGQRPLTGWAGTKYADLYRHLYNTQAKTVGLEKQTSGLHPHMTYLYVPFLAGIPGLLIFLISLGLSLKKAVCLFQYEDSESFPWGTLLFSLFLTVLVYGLTGDILVGRRDISVMFWCFWGVLLALPQRSSSSDER